jgi:chemotaxis protein methyltransferase CheR
MMPAPVLAPPPAAEGDVPFTAADFSEISRTVGEVAGIQLRAGKEGLVRARLARRLREVGARSYAEYLGRVRADASRRELAHMVDLLTTNKTSFFREAAHFDVLRDAVAPAFAGAPGGHAVWSAGCSSGEEPYTIAMVLRDALAEPRGAGRVLATDISERVLAAARAGVYADDVGPTWTRRSCGATSPPRRAAAGRWRRRCARPVQFAPLNLMGPWPMRGPFHAIFCRNVMIYFDKPTQAALVRRYHELLAPGGYLFVGHSESLSAWTTRSRTCSPAVYRK